MVLAKKDYAMVYECIHAMVHIIYVTYIYIYGVKRLLRFKMLCLIYMLYIYSMKRRL